MNTFERQPGAEFASQATLGDLFESTARILMLNGDHVLGKNTGIHPGEGLLTYSEKDIDAEIDIEEFNKSLTKDDLERVALGAAAQLGIAGTLEVRFIPAHYFIDGEERSKVYCGPRCNFWIEGKTADSMYSAELINLEKEETHRGVYWQSDRIRMGLRGERQIFVDEFLSKPMTAMLNEMEEMLPNILLEYEFGVNRLSENDALALLRIVKGIELL